MLEAGVAPTDRIEQRDDTTGDKVDPRERDAMVRWRFEMIGIDGPVELPDRSAINRKIPKDGKTMDQGEMEQVKNEGDFPKRGKDWLTLDEAAFKQRKK